MNVTFAGSGNLPDFTELEVPEIVEDDNGLTVKRRLQCRWEDRHELRRALRGGGQMWANGNLVVTVPHVLTLGESADDRVLCRRVSVTGFNEATDGNQSIPSDRSPIASGEGSAEEETCEVIAEYDNSPFFWTEEYDTGGEVITATGSKSDRIYWKSDNALIDAQVVRPLLTCPKGRWNVVYLALAYLPPEFTTMENCINSQTVRAIGLLIGEDTPLAWTKGQLLYTRARVTPVSVRFYDPFNLSGQVPLWRVELPFEWDLTGHNDFLRPGKIDTNGVGVKDSMQIKDGATYKDYLPHPEADLRKLVGQA